MIGGDTTIVGEEGESRPRALARGEPPPGFARGDEIGRYVVLHQLGRGGMGVVYAAFDPQLDRKVALKVLHHGARAHEGSEGQPRLLREAQALAKLSHPNVVAVHDVGVHGEDVFIAMEFVSGETLGQWAGQPRPWRELVAVLIAAGEGVAAAHRAGIVHRDFKPDNVMLDAEGRPRVLDFGLARAATEASAVTQVPESSLELSLSSASLSTKLTQTGALMGTPAYMAPEQYAGAQVDARTDQFAFCVSAYETLYGERPFAGDSVAAVAFAIHQGQVREAPRDTQVPSWLRKVILRGLETEPQARWPSMDALLAAMGRDPQRRQRRIGIGVAVVLAVGLLGAWVQRSLAARGGPCRDASAHLEGVWDEQARAAVDAAFDASGQAYAGSSARSVIARLDSYAEAWVGQRTEACEATRIRGEQSDEVLSLRMACLDRSLAQLDGLAQVYREADAEVVSGALEAIDSLPPLTVCADVEGLLSGIRAPSDASTLARVEQLRAQLDKARSLELAGKRAEARETLAGLEEEVLAVDYRPLIAEFSLVYGPMLDAPEPRASRLERAAWMGEASRHDRVAASAWIELVEVYTSLTNNFPYAEMAVRRADAGIARLAHGEREDADLRVRLQVAEARLRDELGEFERALELLLMARDGRVALGQTASPVGFEELVALCNVMMQLGDHQRAEPLLREALAEAEAGYGREHPWYARLRSTLARVHFMNEDYEAAEAALLDALAVFERAYGGSSNNSTGILNGIALVRGAAGNHAGALEAYERALSMAAELEIGDSLHTATIHQNMASLERKLERPERAVEHLELALEVRRKAFGAQAPDVFEVRRQLAAALLAAGELERAAQELGALLADREASEGAESPDLVSTLELLARVEEQRGDEQGAAAARARARALAPRGAGDEDAGPSPGAKRGLQN